VCPLRGQSLESRLAAQRSVVQALRTNQRMGSEMVAAAAFSGCLLFLVVAGVGYAMRTEPKLSRARVIIPATILFAVTVSTVYELSFGSGPAGVPAIVLAATVGGTIWGVIFAGMTAIARKAGVLH